MAFEHGTRASLKVGLLSADTDISDYSETAGLSLAPSMAAIRTWGIGWEQQIAGIIAGTLKNAGALDPTLDALIFSAITTNKSKLKFEYGPMGTESGNPKYTGQLVISGYNIESPDNKVGYDWTGAIDGEVTRGVYG